MNLFEYLHEKVAEFDFLAGYQLLLGLLLVIAGLVVALFPAILVALVVAGLVTAGASLIASAWRRRYLRPNPREHTRIEFMDW